MFIGVGEGTVPWGQGLCSGDSAVTYDRQASPELGFLSFTLVERREQKEEGPGVAGMAGPGASLSLGGLSGGSG